MSIGYIVIMIRFIIIFTTRVKRFLHYFLRIVRVYPIDTANNPLHERETAQPSIRPGTRSRTTGAAIAAMSAQPYSRVFTWDAQPYHLGAAITATSAQPCSRVFTWDAQPYYLGAAITATSAAMQPSIHPGTRNRTAWAQPIHSQVQRKNKSGAPAACRIPCNEMKNSPNGVKNKQRTKAVNAFLFIMQNRVKSK